MDLERLTESIFLAELKASLTHRRLKLQLWDDYLNSVRSLTVLKENIVVTVLVKLVPLFFLKYTCVFFFLTRSLIDGCQMVTDTCKNDGSLLKFTQMKMFR